MNKSPAAPKFEDQVRFNWGFHDAVADCKNKARRDVSDHFDKVYAEGYERGREAFNARGDDGKEYYSTDAWRQRQQAKKDEAARRKALRNARPDGHVVRI